MKPLKRLVARAARWPLAIETAYRRDLYDLIKALDQEARAQIAANGQAMLDAAAVRQDADGQGWAAILEQMLVQIGLSVIFKIMDVDRLMSLRGRQADEFLKRDWRKAVRASYGIDVVRGNEAWLPDTMASWEAENRALIKSIPTNYTDRLRGEFVRGVTEGRSLRDLTAMVRETTGVGQKRAVLVARDQLGKLTSQLVERRQRDLGVKSFLWRTVGDERVRPLHRQRDGKEFRYDVPGPRPGLEIRCRCSAAAILPGLTADDIREL